MEVPIRMNEGKVDWTLLPWDNTLLWWLNDKFTSPKFSNENSLKKALLTSLYEEEIQEVLFYSLFLTYNITEREKEKYEMYSINLPWDALEQVCRVFQYGTVKYQRDNYKIAPGLPLENYIQSMWRHTVSYLKGEENDTDSGLPNLAHLACNAFMYLWTQKEYHSN
jgi:hypothetical protein